MAEFATLSRERATRTAAAAVRAQRWTGEWPRNSDGGDAGDEG